MKQRHSKSARNETDLFPADLCFDAMAPSAVHDRRRAVDPERE
jgi:hypothetical protein